MTVEAPKPPRSKKSTKGDAPVSPVAAAALVKAGHTYQPSPEALVTANFKIDAELKQDMKMFAAMHKMSMVAVLREGYALLKASKSAK